MARLFDRGAKTAPSLYPRVPFHVLRLGQLVSSVIVGGIMAYFTWHLRQSNYKEPWTFIWLFSASLASIAALAFTICLHCFTGLNPRLNIAINAFLSVIWALSWSLLTYYMHGTLTNYCDAKNWNEDVGMMVCRIYKALFAFTLLGLLSTLAALGLDLYVRRQQTRRGIYRLQDIDVKGRPEPNRNPFAENTQNHSSVGLAAPQESEAWEEPRRSRSPHDEQPGDLEQYGAYSHPAEFGKYDTGYHGIHTN